MPRPGTDANRDEIDGEEDLLPREPHDQRRVGMVEADIAELERGVSELNRPAGVDGLIGQYRGGILEHREARFRPRMRDDGGPRLLERLAARDVIEMVVAVDQVLDRLRRDLFDLLQIGRHGLRSVRTRSGRWR